MADTLQAVAQAYLGELPDVHGRIAEALALARELNHKYMQSQVLIYQVDVLLQLGRLGEARAQGRVLQALLTETGDRDPESRVNVLMAEALGREGDLVSARAVLDRALTASVAARARGMQVRVLATMAWLSLQEGGWREAKGVAEEALPIAKAIGSQYQMARLQCLLGSALMAGGQPGAAAAFEAAVSTARTIGAGALHAQALFGLAAADPHAPRAFDHAAEAARLLERLVAPLDAESRAAYLSLKERAQVASGDHIGFGRPVREGDDGRVSPSRLVLNQGLWNMP
jgi:tetratricopeptide (TPR) repeat protein